jgi:hypothetical protein
MTDEIPIMMPVVTSKTFTNETVILDGTHFDKCEFVHCVLLFRGGFYGLTDCIYRFVTWRFQDEASRTVELIRKIASTEPDFEKWLLRKDRDPKRDVQ